MTIKDIFSIAIRIMGIYFLFILITDLPAYLLYITMPSDGMVDNNSMRLIAIFCLFFYCVFTYFCLFKANDIAESIAAVKTNAEFWNRETALKIDKELATYFAVIFLGLWMILDTIPSFLHYLIDNLHWENGGLKQDEKNNFSLDMVFYVIKIITGISAIYFNRPVVNYVLQRSKEAASTDSK